MTAAKIELYLKPSGDELERAEAYEKLTLREQNRKTTGARLTYTTADEKYVVTGAPVKIVDECEREDDRQDVDLRESAPIGSSSTATSRSARRPRAEGSVQ